MKLLPLRFKSSFHSSFGTFCLCRLEPCQVVPVGGAGGAREPRRTQRLVSFRSQVPRALLATVLQASLACSAPAAAVASGKSNLIQFAVSPTSQSLPQGDPTETSAPFGVLKGLGLLSPEMPALAKELPPLRAPSFCDIGQASRFHASFYFPWSLNCHVLHATVGSVIPWCYPFAIPDIHVWFLSLHWILTAASFGSLTCLAVRAHSIF